MVEWLKVVELVVDIYELYRIVFYFYELVSCLYGYWNRGKELLYLCFIDVNNLKLILVCIVLVCVVFLVIVLGFVIFGVEGLEEMC